MSSSNGREHDINHQLELIDEFDRLLGRCIRQFQQLEKIVEFRTAQLANSTSEPFNETARFLELALAELSFSSKLRLMSSLLINYVSQRREYKVGLEGENGKSIQQETERAIDAIKRLSDLEQSRNRYVHSHWFAIGPQPDDNENPFYRHKLRATSKGENHIFESFSLDEFRKYLEDSEVAVNEIAESTGRLLGLLDYDEGKKQRLEQPT